MTTFWIANRSPKNHVRTDHHTLKRHLDRCVWGSDWPHVGFWGAMPNVGDLLDLLADWAPDPTTLEAILTTNAQRLYGFPDTHP
jgi:predicted TIM-barrel fold metal-dependent hydrolase